MESERPFIPLDRPRLWVVTVLAGLNYMAIALLTFAVSHFEIKWLNGASIGILGLAWLIFAGSMIGYSIRAAMGKYKNIKPRPWREQIW